MSTEPERGQEAGLEELLQYIKDSRGFDFTGYKRASLNRRIRKRMATAGAEGFVDYRDRLAEDPDEFVELFNTILINVTAFRRDPDAWDYLARSVVPRILEAKSEDLPIRVWSAGCASGEETYSIAVLLCDAMGEDHFRRSVKIYGTDADNEALASARQARFPMKSLTDAFTEEQVARYFERDEGAMTFRKDLRRAVIFGRHDLVRDPPISRVDLLLCRNTLMYLTSEVQRRILISFHFALNDGGFLFLGKSESLVTRTNLFAVDDLRRHVFQKVADRVSTRNGGGQVAAAPSPALESSAGLTSTAFEQSPSAQLVVDRAGTLVLINRRARAMFGLVGAFGGMAFRDLELSYRPAELRSRIEEVLADRQTVTVNEVETVLAGGTREWLDIELVPLMVDGSTIGVGITFHPVGRYKVLRDQLDRSQVQLEAAYEELQSTVEELETTNEELQSTNEELETTNEELHSTNEELETMNEELQSTNEELETINNELRDRTHDLDDLSTFLQSILGSFPGGVVVLNQTMAVRVWNRQCEDLWGLRADEVEGQHFLNLDFGLAVQELRPLIRACLQEHSEGESLTLAAVNRRGRAFSCRVLVCPLRPAEGDPAGVIVLMDDAGAGPVVRP